MKFENVYFINGTAYAGKSTMVKLLAEKYDGIACEENYQDRLLENLDTKEFPNLTYTRDLQDWGEFVRRTPDEYEAWVNGVTKECTVLEIEILKDLVSRTRKKIFVDTNISVEILHEISDENHVLINQERIKDILQRLNKKPDKSVWEMPGNLNNACYDPYKNDLTFPAGILQAPFYDAKQSRAANYGGIGATIGHEVSHAFDNNGAQFDEKGNMKNWWTKED